MLYLDLLRRYWWCGIIALLAISLIATRSTLYETKAERDVAYAQLDVSNASIGILTKEIDRIMREQIALSTSDAQRIADGKQAVAVVEAANRVRQAAIAKLNASALVVRSSDNACEFSEAVIREWP